jgi:hypothetical protein
MARDAGRSLVIKPEWSRCIPAFPVLRFEEEFG